MTSHTTRSELLAGITAVFLIGMGALQLVLGEFISNSVALIANGFDCIGDGIVSVIVWAGLKYFARPADHKFHYGYHKLENLSAGAAAIVMLFLAVYIAYRSYGQLTDPGEIGTPQLGAAVAFSAGFGAILLGIIKYRTVRSLHLQSVRLEAFNTIKDGTTSFLTVIALVLAGLGYTIVDALVGFIIAVVILGICFAALKESSYMLLDACDGQCIDYREVIKNIAEAHRDVKATRIIRVRRSGPVIHSELEIELSGDLTINDLDRIKSELNKEVKEKIPHLERLIITAIAHKKKRTKSFNID